MRFSLRSTPDFVKEITALDSLISRASLLAEQKNLSIQSGRAIEIARSRHRSNKFQYIKHLNPMIPAPFICQPN